MLEQDAAPPLLAVLNSTPTVDGAVVDRLDPATAAPFGASAAQLAALRRARGDLQRVIRGTASPADLQPWLDGVVRRPLASTDGITWTLDGAADALPAARLIMAWSEIEAAMPGRLRACANPECSKFLLDRSKPNTARWCSMASCGNRLKARRFQERQGSAVRPS